MHVIPALSEDQGRGSILAQPVKSYCVYILSNKKNGTLCVGVTSDLAKRIWEHKNKVVKGFTQKYGVDCLVYFEVYEDIESAILREKRIKKWNREWKIRLIEELNHKWEDLSHTIDLL